MKIIYDSAFDGRIWPDLSSTKDGIVGSIRVGPLGMLDILETFLGRLLPNEKSQNLSHTSHM